MWVITPFHPPSPRLLLSFENLSPYALLPLPEILKLIPAPVSYPATLSPHLTFILPPTRLGRNVNVSCQWEQIWYTDWESHPGQPLVTEALAQRELWCLG